MVKYCIYCVCGMIDACPEYWAYTARREPIESLLLVSQLSCHWGWEHGKLQISTKIFFQFGFRFPVKIFSESSKPFCSLQQLMSQSWWFDLQAILFSLYELSFAVILPEMRLELVTMLSFSLKSLLSDFQAQIKYITASVLAHLICLGLGLAP